MGEKGDSKLMVLWGEIERVLVFQSKLFILNPYNIIVNIAVKRILVLKFQINPMKSFQFAIEFSRTKIWKKITKLKMMEKRKKKKHRKTAFLAANYLWPVTSDD